MTEILNAVLAVIGDLFGWQSIVCALTVYGVTQFIKTVIDVHLKYQGKSRRDSLWLNRVVLPAIPAWVGVLFAVIIPVRPNIVISYVLEHHIQGLAALIVYGAWGGGVGMMADSVYNKVREYLATKASSAAG